jgi:hypothetical protein
LSGKNCCPPLFGRNLCAEAARNKSLFTHVDLARVDILGRRRRQVLPLAVQRIAWPERDIVHTPAPY